MKNHFKIILIAIQLLFVGVYSAQSQSVEIIRTDVDSARSSFVTATYLFSFDVQLTDIEGVNNASFKLFYDQADVVEFSGARIGDFGFDGTQYSFSKSPNSDEAELSISVFSGKPLGESDYDNPKVITLEFVVSPAAENADEVTFRFNTALATSYQDGEDRIVNLASTGTIFDIHGFVDVWPGDANNDGTAEIDDMATIGLFIEHQKRYLGTRSFKRKNSSTNWFAQRVLVWDEAEATYADCDGDGDISVSDGLVVFLNESKVHAIDKNGLPNSSSDLNLNPIYSNDYIRVPIRANFSSEYFAAEGSIELNSTNYEIVGIESSDLFYNPQTALIKDIDDNSIDFLIGSFDNNFKVSESGIIADLILKALDNTSTNPELSFNYLNGISRNNQSFDLLSVSDIEPINSINYTLLNRNLIINSPISEITVFDLLGNKFTVPFTSVNTTTSLDLSRLLAGCYFVSYTSNNKVSTIQVILN